jgi:periplasmic protein CpxP/Spy
LSPARRAFVTAGIVKPLQEMITMIQRFRTTIAVTAAAALLATGLATAALAQGGGRRGPDGPGRMGGAGMVLRALDLTEAQREQVKNVMQGHREDMTAIGKRLREAHRAQREAIETVPVNEGLIRSTSQALATAETDMAILQSRIHNEVWNLLTPEQQAKAKELKAQRENRVKQRQQRRPRRQG